MEIKLIAVDLDGTLVNPEKKITEHTLEVLDQAAAQGIQIVPTTGRLFHALPKPLREKPYIRYGICMNGGQIYDAHEDRVLHRDEIPLEVAMRAYDYLERFPVAYDCYVCNKALMEREMLEHLGDYIQGDPHGLAYSTALRTPVDGFRAYLLEMGHPLQKMQAFMADVSGRPAMIREMSELFPELAVTYSLPYNIEINSCTAVKGNALRELCRQLEIPMEQVAAFGDGTNDITMLQAAGVSVAMANAVPEAKAAAKYHTASNAEDGVAQFIERFILK